MRTHIHCTRRLNLAPRYPAIVLSCLSRSYSYSYTYLDDIHSIRALFRHRPSTHAAGLTGNVIKLSFLAEPRSRNGHLCTKPTSSSPNRQIHRQYQIKPECDTQTNRWTIATVLPGHTNIHHALDITLALAPRVIRWPVALGVWARRHPGHVDLDAAVLWMIYG